MRSFHRTKIITLAAPALAGVLALAACSGGGSTTETSGAAGASSAAGSSAAAAEVGSLRIGIGSDPATALYVVAHSQGFFEANGITSEIRQFASGGEAVAAQVSGEVDITSVTEPPFLAAYDKGAKLSIIGTIGQSDNNFGAVGIAGITSAKDLASPDVKIGVTQNSGAHYFLQRYVDEAGVPLDSLNVEYLQVSDLVAAFARGDIQAMFTWTPNVQQGQKTVDGATIFAYSGDVGFPTTMYAVVTDAIAQNAPMAEAVMKSVIEAADWVAQNKDQALQLLADTFHVDAAALELPMSVFDYKVDLTDAQVASFADVAEWMKASQLIGSVPEPTFIVSGPLRAVDPSKVNLTS